jgi:hypothetical protein
MVPRFLTARNCDDPVSGAWSAAGTFPDARDQHTATLLPNGKVLVVGGSNGSTFFNSAEL